MNPRIKCGKKTKRTLYYFREEKESLIRKKNR